MRGDDAKKVCPDIELVQVPMAHGHADVSIYRDAGTEVMLCLHVIIKFFFVEYGGVNIFD